MAPWSILLWFSSHCCATDLSMLAAKKCNNESKQVLALMGLMRKAAMSQELPSTLSVPRGKICDVEEQI